MDALMNRWQQLADRLNGLQTRERALIVLSILLGIYLVWDFGFFQPLAKKNADLEMRLTAAQKELVKLSAEEQVFTQGLRNDPGAAKKREIVRLEQELRSLEENLQQLAVGLIAADKLPQVIYEVLQRSTSLKFVGMQTHPAQLLSFNKQPGSLEGEQETQGVDDSVEPERAVGVFKHAVTVSFHGDYFAVIRYLKSLENLEWKIYWNILDYEVDQYPRAHITLEVFTLSTEQGVMGAGV